MAVTSLRSGSCRNSALTSTFTGARSSASASSIGAFGGPDVALLLRAAMAALACTTASLQKAVQSIVGTQLCAPCLLTHTYGGKRHKRRPAGLYARVVALQGGQLFLPLPAGRQLLHPAAQRLYRLVVYDQIRTSHLLRKRKGRGIVVVVRS